MKVKLTQALCGPTTHHKAGDTVGVESFSKAELQRFVDKGFANPVRSTAKKETAAKKRPATEKTA